MLTGLDKYLRCAAQRLLRRASSVQKCSICVTRPAVAVREFLSRPGRLPNPLSSHCINLVPHPAAGSLQSRIKLRGCQQATAEMLPWPFFKQAASLLTSVESGTRVHTRAPNSWPPGQAPSPGLLAGDYAAGNQHCASETQ